MKKLLTAILCAGAMVITAFAGDEEVTVKVSVAGANNSALKKQCETQGKKAAVKISDFKIERKEISKGSQCGGNQRQKQTNPKIPLDIFHRNIGRAGKRNFIHRYAPKCIFILLYTRIMNLM